MLIDKKYYLNLIKNYKGDFQSKNYIFIYTVLNLEQVSSYVRQINKYYNYKIHWVKEGIEDFIFGIYYSKAVITDSYHGTLFSIIFNKPFITFIYEYSGNERFNSLKEIFNIGNRLFDIYSFPDITLLENPLHLNMTSFNLLISKLKDTYNHCYDIIYFSHYFL